MHKGPLSKSFNFFLSLRWVHHKSVQDVAYGRVLNSAVHNNAFYAACYAMELSKVSPITVTWPDRAVPGRLLIASQATINDIAEFYGKHVNDIDAKECKRALSGSPGKKGWVKEFLEIHNDPERWCAGMDFDLCIDWARAFYFLTPITDMAYLTALYARLEKSGLGLIAFDDLVARRTNGLMGCSCGCFLHRAWCIHAFVFARMKKIITSYPETMHPGQTKGHRGRPNKQAIAILREFEEGGGEDTGGAP